MICLLPTPDVARATPPTDQIKLTDLTIRSVLRNFRVVNE